MKFLILALDGVTHIVNENMENCLRKSNKKYQSSMFMVIVLAFLPHKMMVLEALLQLVKEHIKLRKINEKVHLFN